MDKSLPFYDIIMKAKMQDWPKPSLKEGYAFKNYEDGDEEAWAKLETSVGEFDCIDDARAYFAKTFLPYKQELYERMFFIVDEKNVVVATASAWFKDDENRHYAILHWVSTSPHHQGKGLGKAIVGYALHHFPKIENEKEVFLHTQTWSYNALGIYARFGFKITQDPLVHYTTDMRCIPVLRQVIPDEMMDNLVE